MTAQFSENLIYEGKQVSMCNEPLGLYFELVGIEPKFAGINTALWRGYIGTWEIINDRLYLIDLEGKLEDDAEVTLETFFPGFPDRVFAHWYSRTIRVPQGKMLEYIHMGYGSIYERDLLIKIENGVVKGKWVRENGISNDPDAPEGYSIGAMTIIPRRKKDEVE